MSKKLRNKRKSPTRNEVGHTYPLWGTRKVVRAQAETEDWLSSREGEVLDLTKVGFEAESQLKLKLSGAIPSVK